MGNEHSSDHASGSSHLLTLTSSNRWGAKEVSIVFPLLDISASMHSKLAFAKSVLLRDWFEKLYFNFAALMTFALEPHLLLPISSVEAGCGKDEIREAVTALSAVRSAGADIPRALAAYLGSLERFLDALRVEARPVHKAFLVIITDGINGKRAGNLEWVAIREQSRVLQRTAGRRSCSLFLHVVDLQTGDKDQDTLNTIAAVLGTARQPPFSDRGQASLLTLRDSECGQVIGEPDRGGRTPSQEPSAEGAQGARGHGRAASSATAPALTTLLAQGGAGADGGLCREYWTFGSGAVGPRCSLLEAVPTLSTCLLRRSLGSQDSPAALECPICREAAAESDLIALGCGAHRFCAPCLAAWVGARNEANAEAVCPDPACEHVMTVLEVERICAVGKQVSTAQKYAALHAERNRLKQQDGIHCPKCSNSVCLPLKEDVRFVACRQCSASFCTVCRERPHYKVSCLEYAELKVLQAKTEAERQALDRELRTRQFLLERTRPCPACGIAVTKDWACNAVVCAKCRTKFCYACLKRGDGHSFHACEPKSSRELSRHVERLLGPLADTGEGCGAWRCGCCARQGEGRCYECVNCPDLRLCSSCWARRKTESRSWWSRLFWPARSTHSDDHIFRVVG